MRRLLDTNVFSAFQLGDERVVEIVGESTEVLMSAIVVGEILHGFRGGTKYERNIHWLENFLDSPYVEFLPVSRSTADRYGRIVNGLRSAGTPLPANDVWIAAHAFESGAELISFDQHFKSVPGLVWTDPSSG